MEDSPTALFDSLYKALLQLAFPVHVIFLVTIVIVASECSSWFAKVIGKGNPVAVLATVILLSYAKLFNIIFLLLSLLYCNLLMAHAMLMLQARKSPNSY